MIFNLSKNITKLLILLTVTLIITIFLLNILLIFFIENISLTSHILITLIVLFIFTIFSFVIGINVYKYLSKDLSISIKAIVDDCKEILNGNDNYTIERDKKSNFLPIIETINSITSKYKNSLDKLYSERDKLYSIGNAMTDSVIVIDSIGKITLINQSAQELFDLKISDSFNKRLVNLIRDHELQSLITKTLKINHILEEEIELLEQQKYLKTTTIPINLSSGREIVIIFSDLTKLKQLDITRTEFVTNISHELRSPLANIKAMIETLVNPKINDKEKTEEFLELINQDIDRMTSIVNDLLELSSIQSGHIPIHIAPFDINTVIDQLISISLEKAQSLNIKIEKNIESNLPKVLGNTRMVHQVLLNILTNAFNSINKNGTIQFKTQEEDHNIAILIQDSGKGIAKEHIPHIFERFYKVDKSRRDEGTGLGLAISKHIMNAINGSIKVESQLGNGATFYIIIPKSH